MPVYNRENLIKFSVQSILNQTFKDFEFVIVNDGSTDKTAEIIESFNDKRIKLIHNEKNSGIVFSRNRGIENASGKYIAMFDSDDIAYPTKNEEQIKFLDKNPDFGMIGTWAKFIDQNGTHTGDSWKLPAPAQNIPAMMLFRNYFVQASVVARRNALPKHLYSAGFDIVEDSKMWFEISLKHKVWNLQKYLLDYRVHVGNVTNTGNEKQLRHSRKLFKFIFNHLQINPSEQELDAHFLIKNNEKITNIADLQIIEQWLLKIVRQNDSIGLYDKKILRKIVKNRWLKVCNKAKSEHIKMMWTCTKSPILYL